MFALVPSTVTLYEQKEMHGDPTLTGQGCSKKLCYKWLHSEIVLSHRKTKQLLKQQQLHPSDTFSTMSLGAVGFLWVYAVPDHQLSMGITHPCQGSGVSVRPPLTALEWGDIREPLLAADALQPRAPEQSTFYVKAEPVPGLSPVSAESRAGPCSAPVAPQLLLLAHEPTLGAKA